jgi:hypothetical protein
VFRGELGALVAGAPHSITGRWLDPGLRVAFRSDEDIIDTEPA